MAHTSEALKGVRVKPHATRACSLSSQHVLMLRKPFDLLSLPKPRLDKLPPNWPLPRSLPPPLGRPAQSAQAGTKQQPFI